MEDLHDDLRLEIFSRLPPEPLLKCKLVCKTWESLLSHKKVGLLFLIRSRGQRNLQLYYGDYDEIFRRSSIDEEFGFGSLTKIKHPAINWRESHSFVDIIVGSCNGLVCFRVPHDHVNDPVYICNPVTMEYINLPRLEYKCGYVVSGFGYHSSTDEYKVIRIHYRDRWTNAPPGITDTKGFVEIYTLGSGTGWRTIGEVTYHLSKRGVLANGSLYWLDYKQKRIVAFDLADEQFRQLPTAPQCFDGSKKLARYKIKVLGGDLCLVHGEEGKPMDIWTYKKNGTISWSWNLEFSMPHSLLSKGDICEPFALTKNNEVLLWLNEKCLCCYDKKTETATIVLDEEYSIPTFQGIPHMNSLVSLKALGEKSKIKNSRNNKVKKDEKISLAGYKRE